MTEQDIAEGAPLELRANPESIRAVARWIENHLVSAVDRCAKLATEVDDDARQHLTDDASLYFLGNINDGKKEAKWFSIQLDKLAEDLRDDADRLSGAQKKMVDAKGLAESAPIYVEGGWMQDPRKTFADSPWVYRNLLAELPTVVWPNFWLFHRRTLVIAASSDGILVLIFGVMLIVGGGLFRDEFLLAQR